METNVKRLNDLCHFLLWCVILIALTSLSYTTEQSSNDTKLLARLINRLEDRDQTDGKDIGVDPYFNDFDDVETTLSRKTRGYYDDYYYPIHPPYPKHKKGHYEPVSEYYVKHHKPGYDEWSKKKPEVWEYKGTYHYKKKKKKHWHHPPPPPPFLPAAMVAAGLPLIMMPLISMLMTIPVLVPVNGGGTTIDDGTGFISNVNGGGGSSFITNAGLTNGLNNGGFITNGRKRRAVPNGQPDIQRALKIREMQLVGDYLRQQNYDASQQHRLLSNYLQCQGMLSNEEHCLERMACEFRRRKPERNNKREDLEKTVTSIFLGHILHNEFIPRSFKRRLKNAARFGRQSGNSCSSRYHCASIDGAGSVNATKYSDPSTNRATNQWDDEEEDHERKNLLSGAK